MDLISEKNLNQRLETVLMHHNAIRKGLGKNVFKKDKLKEDLLKIAPEILKFSKPVWKKIYEFKKQNKKILFEGAQGTLLDIDHGTYPFVTSSNTSAGNAAIGSGIGPKNIDRIIGVTKAYISRVGSGPFLTEQKNEVGDYLIEKGAEFGVVTGRRRRCGWLDLISLKYSVRVNSLTELFITKLDVLSGLEKINLCIGYKYENELLTDYPYKESVHYKAEPVYKTFDGWTEDITSTKNFEDLPKNAQTYIKTIEEFIEVPITFISVGPERTENIII